MPQLAEKPKKPNMAGKREKIQKLLDEASEVEIHITHLPSGGTRVDFAPHADTPEEMARWNKALDEAEGMWEDREDIQEEMKTIRKELNRSFPEQDDTTSS